MNWDSFGSKSRAGRLVGGSGLVLALLICAVWGWGVRGGHFAARKSQASPQAAQKKTVPARFNAQSVLSSLPIVFEPNVGQASPAAQLVARGAGYSLAFNQTGAALDLQSSAGAAVDEVRMQFAGETQASAPSAVEPLPGHSNYIIGNDSSAWHTGIPQFARVRYADVYPGISVVFYGTQGQLEYDFELAPGADASRAQLQFSGARHLALARNGDLIIQTAAHSLRFNAPHVYQRDGARMQDVAGRFVLRPNHRVGFSVGSYDRSRELIIDPVLSYSTYFGGNGVESIPSVATDGVNIYLAGATTSNNLPVFSTATTGPFQTTLKGLQNVFVLKLNPQAGNTAAAIEYLTYIGGTGMDSSVGLGVDNAFNAYIAGNTTSTNFPVSLTAYQANPETGSLGTQHAFVTKLDPLGATLLYSSYLSGNGNDTATGMTIDNNSNLYVTGTTTSSDAANSTTTAFPASTLPEGQAYQSSPRAPNQFFVTKVNTAAAGIGSIAYSTYFGGGATPTNSTAIGGGIAVDSSGYIYFTGTTNFINTGSSPLTDFPILNAYQPCLDQPPPNVVVNPQTCTATTATANDAFLTKLNPAAPAQLIFSTYFGGSSDDFGTAVAVDSGAANIYITGKTVSTDVTIPTGIAPFQRCLNTPVNPTTGTCPTGTTGTDAFLARFNNIAGGTTTTADVQNTYFSYFGGSGNESGLAVTVDTTSDAYITGPTNSTDLFPDQLTVQNPQFAPIQSALNGAQNAYLARIDTTTVTSSTNPGNSYVTYFGGNGVDRGTSVVLDASLNSYFAGDTTSNKNFPLAKPFQAQLNGTQNAWVAKLGTAPNLTISGVATYGTGQINFTAGNQATFTYTIVNDGDPATNVTITDDFGSAGIPLTFVTASVTGGNCSSATATTPLVCTLGVLNSGNTATMTVTVVPTIASSFTGGPVNFNGGLVTMTVDANPNGNQTSVSAQATTFGLTVSPSSQTVNAGQSPQFPFVALVAPDPTYGSAVSLSCKVPSAATGVSCAASPASVTPGSSTTSSNISVGTTARPITTAADRRRGPMFAIWLGLPGVAFLGMGAGSKRRRRMLGALALLALAAMFTLEPGCSSNRTTVPPIGTPPGTYPITVTATSGSFSRNATFTLQVN